MEKVNRLFEQRNLNEFAMDSAISKINSNDRIIMTSNDLSGGINNVEQKMNPFLNDKPRGLWYGLGTQWIDWVKREMPEWENDHLYKIEISQNVLVLDSKDKILAFNKQYGFASKMSFDGLPDSIDWVKVAKDYDGIEIITPRRYSDSVEWLYSWDIDSGCLWNKNGLTNISIIKGI